MQAQRTTSKLVESTFVTLDGVISAPQQWGGPKYWDEEYMAYASDLLSRCGRAAAGARDLRGLRGDVAGAAVGPVHGPDQCAAQARRVADAAARRSGTRR